MMLFFVVFFGEMIKVIKVVLFEKVKYICIKCVIGVGLIFFIWKKFFVIILDCDNVIE